MANIDETIGDVPSVAVAADIYNTYGLATQGFVWAAISSVSGDWGRGHVKSINHQYPDVSGNVTVSEISSIGYDGEVNAIRSDFTAVIDGEDEHRILTDIDDNNIRSSFQTRFDSLCSLIPTEATSANKLADKAFVMEQSQSLAPSFRGSFSTWSTVPTSTSQYMEDRGGNRIPRGNDYINILDASQLTFRSVVGNAIIGETLAEAVLSFEAGHVLTATDISTLVEGGVAEVSLKRTGTWRFVFVGNWEVVGRNGWQGSYRLASTSFTEQQWAAINSGITESSFTALKETSGRWNSVSDKLESLSARWQRAATTTITTSARNESVYNSTHAHSGEWNRSYTVVSETSANNQTAFSTLTANSGDWSMAYATVDSLSARWSNAATETEAVSSNNRSAYSTLNSLSGRWNDAYSEISATSSNNRSVYSTVNANSGGWEQSTETVEQSSGNWSSVYASVKAASSRWDETSGSTKGYTDMIGASALSSAKTYSDTRLEQSVNSLTSAINPPLCSVYTTVSTTSAAWNNATTEISATSSNNRSVYSTVETNSGNWENVFTAVTTSGSGWNSTYSTVAAHSADWNATSGSTKEYTDMVGASALSTANSYTDEKSLFMATSALTTAKGYTDSALESGLSAYVLKLNGTATGLTLSSTDTSNIAVTVGHGGFDYTSDGENYYSNSLPFMNGILVTETHVGEMLSEHTTSTSNPHNVTTEQIGAISSLSGTSFDQSFVTANTLTAYGSNYGYIAKFNEQTVMMNTRCSREETFGTQYGWMTKDGVWKIYIYDSGAVHLLKNDSNRPTQPVSVQGLPMPWTFVVIGEEVPTVLTLKSARTVTTSELFHSMDEASSAYHKPMSGIPASDFTSSVQASLSAADTAYTSSVEYVDSELSKINRVVRRTISAAATENWDYFKNLYTQPEYYPNPKCGDVLVLKRKLDYDGTKCAERTYEYAKVQGREPTSYEWFSINHGKLFDDVRQLKGELRATADIGELKIDHSTGNVLVGEMGDSLEDILEKILCVRRVPSVTPPHINSITLSGFGAYEAGTVVTPVVSSLTTTAGVYEFGPEDSEAEVSSINVHFNGTSRSALLVNGELPQPMSLPQTTISDEMSSYGAARTISITGNYSGDNPLYIPHPYDNLGQMATEVPPISPSSFVYHTTECLKSYRKAFYGYLNDNVSPSTIEPSVIRGLQHSTDFTPNEDTVLSFVYPLSAKAVVFAYPLFCGNAAVITDHNMMDMNIIDAFDAVERDVVGANDYNFIKYRVYVKNSASPNDRINRYTLKFKE